MQSDRGGEQAFDELAEGGLRGPAQEAWRLCEASWAVLSRRVAVFQRALGVREENWDDCGQEALLRVWRGRAGYRGSTGPELSAWIYRIVEREHLRLVDVRAGVPKSASELTGEHERPGEDPMAMRATTSEDPTAESAEKKDSLRALADCLRRLRAEARGVVELLYSADAPTEREVAAVMGVSKSQVHALRKDALARLATCLNKSGEKTGEKRGAR